MKKLLSLILALATVFSLCACASEGTAVPSDSTSGAPSGSGDGEKESPKTSILDKNRILSSAEAAGKKKLTDVIGHSDGVHTTEGETLTRGEWLESNIPFIETPDALLDRVYYFRWNNLLTNLGKRASDGKYEFTESSERGSYHRYIDCAQGQHVLDARWIRDNSYLNDYIDVTPQSEQYWGYLIAAVLEKYYLDGDLTVIEENYNKLKSRFHSRNGKFDSAAGLYYLQMGSEGQEAGVNGFERITRESTYEASFTADGSSVEALRDNLTSGAYWSAKGSGNASDYVEITMGESDAIFTGLRIWFKSGKQMPEVSVFNDYVITPVANVSTVNETDGMLELSFDKKTGDKIKIELKNAEVYEIVPLYEYTHGTSGFWKVLGGDDSYRIGSNSYMAAAAIALSEMAQMLGKTEDAEKYSKIGKDIVSSMLDTLWDPEESFFFELTKWDKNRVVGKESNCYAPWAFGLIPDTEEYAQAWKYLMDEDVFLAAYGITTLDQGSPHYMQPFNHGCLWNGPVWPYTFSMILTAMANHLRSESVDQVTNADYYDLLKRYCECHLDGGLVIERLTIRENHHPDEKRWLAQCPDYNHSSFIDNVLSGLIGIRPSKDGLEIDPIVPEEWEYFCVENVLWRGKNVTVLYDKNGDRYGMGEGFKVIINGETVHASAEIETVKIAA